MVISTPVTLTEYFVQVEHRLPSEAARVLRALGEQGRMNKEELSLTSRVKRAVLDHIIMQLYALGLVDVMAEGKSKICSLTKLGWEFIELKEDQILQ